MKEKYDAYNELLNLMHKLICGVLTGSIVFLGVGLGYFMGETLNLVTSADIPLVTFIGVAMTGSGKFSDDYSPKGVMVTLPVLISIAIWLLILAVGVMGIYTR